MKPIEEMSHSELVALKKEIDERKAFRARLDHMAGCALIGLMQHDPRSMPQAQHIVTSAVAVLKAIDDLIKKEDR